MENPEEILHSLEEFSKSKSKDIPRELEDYLCFVAKTGDPIYQWSAIKSLFREKMINVITEFYEACPSVDIPPCPNVDLFNYDVMKNFILEKLETFNAAPFTVQRICELLTTPRKEYNRIDKFMRALEKNILVVSTTEPGGRRSTENGEGIVNGLESEHLPETSNSSNDINVEEMDDTPPAWSARDSIQTENEVVTFHTEEATTQIVQETVVSASKISEATCSSSQDTVITCRTTEETFVSIEPVPSDSCSHQETIIEESDVSVTITAIPAGVQKRRNSVEPVVSSDTSTEEITESCFVENSEQRSEPSPKSDDQQNEVEPQESSSSSSTSSSLSSTSSIQEIKDADSSSNPEDEEELLATNNKDLIEEQTILEPPVTFDENASMGASCSSNQETNLDEASSNELITQNDNEIGSAEINEDDEIDDNDDTTTKCSPEIEAVTSPSTPPSISSITTTSEQQQHQQQSGDEIKSIVEESEITTSTEVGTISKMSNDVEEEEESNEANSNDKSDESQIATTTTTTERIDVAAATSGISEGDGGSEVIVETPPSPSLAPDESETPEKIDDPKESREKEEEECTPMEVEEEVVKAEAATSDSSL